MRRSIAAVMFFRHPAFKLPLVALLVASCSGAPSRKPKASDTPTSPVVFRDVRVFDGDSVTESTNVLVVGDKIEALGTAISIPPDAQVIQGQGMTLMPGFIDAHTHVMDVEQLKQAAVFGVTTELDMMTDRRVLANIKHQFAAGGLTDAADFRSAGNPYTVEGGHGTEYGYPVDTIADPADARDFVRRRIAEGSDYIKFMFDDGSAWGEVGPSLSRSLLEAGVAAAHAEKRLALVHIGTSDDAMAVVQSGADGLMHLWVGANSPELVAQIKQQHVFVVPTLSVCMSVAENGQGQELVRDPRLAPYLSERAIGKLYSGWGIITNIDSNQFAPIVVALHQQHVPLVVGTDAGNVGVDHGVSMHGELRLLTEAGVPPIDALKGATSLPASIFQLTDRGRVAQGKRADLLLVKGDPTKNITATRDIVAVWKAGRRIDRETYRARMAAERAQERPHFPRRVIGDFETSDTKSLGLAWTVSTDLYLGGRSKANLEMVEGGAQGTQRSLRVSGEAVRSTTRHTWSGVLYSPGDVPMQLVDLSGWRELVFWVKGKGEKLQVHFFLGSTTVPQSQSFVANPEWTEYRFDFRRFGGTLGKDIKGIFFGATGPATYEFTLDQVQLQ
jgi:imidazolonepropionase-like amidohydrolase